MHRFRLVVILVVLVAAGCSPRGWREPTTRGDILAYAELSRYATVLEAVQGLRSSWLVQRSPTAPGFPMRAPVWVFLDGTRVGEADYLGTLGTSRVSYVRYYSGVAAVRLWGQGHENGVIFVATR